MKIKRFLSALLMLIMAALVCVAVAACKPEEEPDPNAGKERGEYYCDTENGEYLLTLSEGNKFTLKTTESKSGEYTITDGILAFNFGSERINAKFDGETIRMAYNDEELTFIRKVEYTVTFNSMGGSAVAAAKVINGRKAIKPEDPTKDKSVFLNWYTSNEYKTIFNFDEDVITEDIELFARWVNVDPEQQEYTVDFYLYEGSVKMPSMQTIGGKLYGIEDPTRPNYRFLGWWISMYDNGQMLTYKYSEANTVFTEDTTLYAVWRSNSSSQKLAEPEVSVTSSSISWTRVSGAEGYKIVVENSEGEPIVEEDRITSLAYSPTPGFASMPEGDYVIKVTALATSASNNSETVRYYKNKALSRVSHFIVDGKQLAFVGVPNATNYYITVECGNPAHNHTDVLVNNMKYDFTNCPLGEDGISFTVRASATGYADSVSRAFVYDNKLNKVTGLSVDEETDTVTWDAVQNATSYVVTVKCGDGEHSAEVKGTKFSLKECAPSTDAIKISVQAKANGYNPSKVSEIEYAKRRIATPSGIELDGYTLRWNAVTNAVSYTVELNGEELDAITQTEIDLQGRNWQTGASYTIRVRANAQAEENNSLWSDEINGKFNSMSGVLAYENGVVSWDAAIGAEFYEVQLNGQTVAGNVTGTSYAITFNQPGVNTIRVRCVAGGVQSEWLSTEVNVYMVTFRNQNVAVATMYKADGDEIELPDATKRGYTLIAWYSQEGGPEVNSREFGKVGDTVIFEESGDLVMYAYWQANYYKVKYNYGVQVPSDLPPEERVQFDSGYTLIVPVPYNAGYVFLGWYDAAGDYGVRLTDENGVSRGTWDKTNENAIEVYAHWAHVFIIEDDVIYKTKTDEKGNVTIVIDEFGNPVVDVRTSAGFKISAGPDIGSYTEVVIPEKSTLITYTSRTGNFITTEMPITRVVESAFVNNTRVTKISIPDSIAEIDIKAFRGCTSLESIVLYRAKSAEQGRYRDIDGVLVDTMQSGDKTVNRILFFPLARTGEYTVPNTINEIGDTAFRGTNITKLTVPANVEYIRSNAFENCSLLSEVSIASSGSQLVAIEMYAFSNCVLLEHIVLPGLMTSLGNNAFENCKNLVDVTINGKLDEIGDSVFSGCANLQRLTVASSVYSIGASAFAGCAKLENVSITAGLITIGDRAFDGCSGLTAIAFGNSLTTVGQYAFQNCNSLKTISLPESLTTLGNRAFSGCSGITEIYISGSVTSFGTAVFESCTRLSKVTIGEGLKIIGNSAFRNTAIVEFRMPDSVQEIGEYAFYYTTSLTRVVIGSGLKTIGVNAFLGCDKIDRVYYKGANEAAWNSINTGGSGNDKLVSARRYYYSAERPTGSGRYWYYDNDGNIQAW